MLMDVAAIDYIDRDIRNSFKCLEIGGILWMDDYGGFFSNIIDF